METIVDITNYLGHCWVVAISLYKIENLSNGHALLKVLEDINNEIIPDGLKDLTVGVTLAERMDTLSPFQQKRVFKLLYSFLSSSDPVLSEGFKLTICGVAVPLNY